MTTYRFRPFVPPYLGVTLALEPELVLNANRFDAGIQGCDPIVHPGLRRPIECVARCSPGRKLPRTDPASC